MKILYDYQIFVFQKYGGISRYFSELISQYSSMPGISCKIAILSSNNANFTDNPVLNDISTSKERVAYKNLISYLYQFTKIRKFNPMVTNQSESVRMLKKQDFNLFHPTYYDPYFLKYLGNKPFVLTVYDMIHEEFPQYFPSQDPISKWKKQLIERADCIIAISNSTKNDIIRFSGVDPSKISVIYLGNPFESHNIHNGFNIQINEEFIKKKYILFVGNRSGYKNFIFFIKSIAAFLRKNKQIHLYCAGGGPFTADEIKMLIHLDVSSQVQVFQINDNRLKTLYENAEVFIFPSLYEGFGLPVLEAFSCGCPVIAGNCSSLPEIAADAAYYIDPLNSESIVHAVENIIFDRNFRKHLIMKGYKRLQFFSWMKTADETRKVYERLLSQ